MRFFFYIWKMGFYLVRSLVGCCIWDSKTAKCSVWHIKHPHRKKKEIWQFEMRTDPTNYFTVLVPGNSSIGEFYFPILWFYGTEIEKALVAHCSIEKHFFADIYFSLKFELLLIAKKIQVLSRFHSPTYPTKFFETLMIKYWKKHDLHLWLTNKKIDCSKEDDF